MTDQQLALDPVLGLTQILEQRRAQVAQGWRSQPSFALNSQHRDARAGRTARPGRTVLERDGAQVTLKPTSEFAVAAEFQRALDGSIALREAFVRLTPGRQRGYLLHFAAAKRSVTREARVERAIDRILDGFGVDD